MQLQQQPFLFIVLCMHQPIFDLALYQPKKSTLVIKTSDKLAISDVINLAYTDSSVQLKLSKSHQQKINTVHQKMLEQVADGTPIYGTTASYGGRASLVLNQGQKDQRLDAAQKLSEAIVHVDVSTGKPLPKPLTRAAMLIRLNMLLSGHSAIRLQTLQSLVDLINSGAVPIVGRYGTVGASGDLAQNGRVLSVLRHLPHTQVWDKSGHATPSATALAKLGLKPLKLAPKEGLGLVNGDNFSTAAATLVAHQTSQLLLTNFAVAALSIQALKGSVRDFHPLLSHIRPHPGQKLTASILRHLLLGSQLAYQELDGHQSREPGVSVQDVYSIRCLPQYYGPDLERLGQTLQMIHTNTNSVSDNPLWTTPETTTPGEAPYNWISGGNFLAMHMSEALDSIRKLVVHMVKQNDRHLNRMVNPHLNNGLPANLSAPEAISQCTFKGLQTQMGMFEVYATLMANPVNTAFGVHEELNQDITSHALTSAILTWDTLKIARRAIATNFIAACQAIDLRGGPQLLSPTTQPYYHWLREQIPFITTEQPLGHHVDSLARNLKHKKLISLHQRTFHDFKVS